MIVGKKKAAPPPPPANKSEEPQPQKEDHEKLLLESIANRDYSGAATYIEFMRDELNLPYTKELALWHGYSLFHLGEYTQAIDVYERLLEEEPEDTSLNLYIASCQFYNQDYEKARASAEKGPSGDFRTRLLFHIAHQLQDEQQLFQAHSQLVGTMENQLCLAAIHYLRANYSDAIEIYRRILQQNPTFLALNVYIAMCEFKLDHFDESNESVDQYLAVNSDSAVGLNLKACDYLRLFDAEIAESQLLQIKKFSSASYNFVNGLIQHNVVVFHNGEDGFQVLPPLVNSLPEARFNLAVLYLRENNATEAYNLLQNYVPIDVSESILKATAMLAYGQLSMEATLIEEANATFAEVGDMVVVRDTVPGRECMATSKFILGEYEESLRYLSTIEQHVGETDEFNYNKAMALAALSRWAEAEQHFLLVKSPQYTSEIYYTSWLARCYIKNGKMESAWNLYLEATQTEDAKTLLQIISIEGFLSGDYYYAMRAYDLLYKFSGEPTNREGMIASAVAVFRGVLSKTETPDKLSDVLGCLSSEPEAAETYQIIQDYIDTYGEAENAY